MNTVEIYPGLKVARKGEILTVLKERSTQGNIILENSNGYKTYISEADLQVYLAGQRKEYTQAYIKTKAQQLANCLDRSFHFWQLKENCNEGSSRYKLALRNMERWDEKAHAILLSHPRAIAEKIYVESEIGPVHTCCDFDGWVENLEFLA